MNIAIILIAGNSTRVHTDSLKQFILINDVPLFIYTCRTFNSCKQIDEIVLVTKKESIEYVKEQVKRFNIDKVNLVVEGGSSRQESVYKGLCSKTFDDNDIILIHDGARALIDERIIIDNINSCKQYNAVTTAIKVSDTLLNADGDLIKNYISRDNAYRVQTPQTFKYKIIKDAHEKNVGKNATDDSSLVSLYYQVHLVLGEEKNIKLTIDEDVDIFKCLLQRKENRK